MNKTFHYKRLIVVEDRGTHVNHDQMIAVGVAHDLLGNRSVMIN